jgi:hypothetical protein
VLSAVTFGVLIAAIPPGQAILHLVEAAIRATH